MNKKDKEDSKIDYIDNFPLNHDLYWKHKGFDGNVRDTRGSIQIEDLNHSTSTITSVQYD